MHCRQPGPAATRRFVPSQQERHLLRANVLCGRDRLHRLWELWHLAFPMALGPHRMPYMQVCCMVRHFHQPVH